MHPSLEMPRGEDPDLLKHLLANMVVECPASSMPLVRTSETEYIGDARERGVEEVSAADATRSALPASGPVALVVLPPIMLPPTELCMKKRIILSFVERSTWYVVV